jgi:aspartyl-tRNA(Asn)/glutamyl-tRNA(Gln) amidotransferase subunit B
MAERSVLENYPEYQVDIGIEVHVQLTTQTKIFCTCANQVVKEPNTNVCQICMGHPGVLPVLNEKVLEYAIRAGLATNCTINTVSEFDRKHYFYPDLPKSYQITQNERPICTNGFVTIRLEDGSKKNIRLMRIHIEEDAGKNIHAPTGESFVDLNRAGTPLLETVTHPDIKSAYEAKMYLQALRSIVQYIGICSGNMEEGAFRGDTNISVRKKNATELGTKVELKNINSFKFIYDAIEYEIERQIELLESGKKVKQETRLWDTKDRKTVVMRSKEEAADYRYFTDPDLPRIVIDKTVIDAVKATLPELPEQKFERLCAQYGITPYEAAILVEDVVLADYYEQSMRHTKSKNTINWLLRDVLSYLKEEKIEIGACNVTPQKLAQLVDMLDKGLINNRAAQEVFKLTAQTGQDPVFIVKEKGLEQIGSAEDLEKAVKEVIDAHPSQVAEYKAGQQRVFGFFVGQVMQKTKGNGNPKLIQDLLKKYLS